jgi:hypothetical protein
MDTAVFFKKNKFYFLGFLVLGWVILANWFPKGYVFAGGDTAQMISLKSYFGQFFFDWQGRISFYYLIFYFLDRLKVSDSAQLSFYLGIMIFGAYISFDIFFRLILKNLSVFLKAGISLFYALNLYTLFLFTGNAGFSYYPSLYIFIPLLIAFFLKLLETKEFKFGVFFVLTLFLGSSGFGNPAFFISLFIFLALIFIFSIILKTVELNKKLALNLLTLVMLSFFVSAFWILPLLPLIKNGIASVASSETLDFNWVIRSTASPVWNTLSLIHFSRDHFPFNFPYKNIDYFKNAFIAIAFLPVIVVFWGLAIYKKFETGKRNYFLVFSGVTIVITMLAARITPPFEITNYYIYHLWGMSVLRGFDKTGIYLPFVLSFLVAIVLSSIGRKKLKIGIMIVILLIPLPFYLGKLQQNVGYRFSREKNYKTASMSFLVKIPEEYYKIREVINSDPEKSFIVSLPNTKNDGTGISDFPKWKLYGVDITRYLYTKSFIGANESHFENWSFAENFNEDFSGNYDWLIKLLGAMNGKYIIYHKDTSSDTIRRSQFKMENLEEKGLIVRLEDNDYFSLYKIIDEYRVSYISWQREDARLDNPRIFRQSGADIEKTIQPADFHQINPKKYIVNPDAGDNAELIIAEPYDANWKAYTISIDGREKEIGSHFKARGYANGWIIEKNPDIKQILIEYYPERLMWKGIAASFLTVLCLIGYLIRYYYVKRGKITPGV